jgi:protein-L-isoaspartate(D-aspartate) O-methyltransferase
MELDQRRRFFAEEIQAASNLKTTALIEGLATLPRERFLPRGPWTVRSEADFFSPPRQTPDDDPRHVYHNLSVAIDPARQLFNGMPGFVAMIVDRLALRPGARVLHVGCGTGYYTALIAGCVGPAGRVLALEVDEALAADARANLAALRWTEVRHADGSDALDEPFDAILVNAGVTHPLDAWLDALAAGGRMMLPLTTAMAPTVSKGVMLELRRGEKPQALDVRLISIVSIYSAIGLRDQALNDRIGAALKRNPFPALKRFRRDQHAEDASCWLHTAKGCWSLENKSE